jgi:hypothetical protein
MHACPTLLPPVSPCLYTIPSPHSTNSNTYSNTAGSICPPPPSALLSVRSPLPLLLLTAIYLLSIPAPFPLSAQCATLCLLYISSPPHPLSLCSLFYPYTAMRVYLLPPLPLSASSPLPLLLLHRDACIPTPCIPFLPPPPFPPLSYHASSSMLVFILLSSY